MTTIQEAIYNFIQKHSHKEGDHMIVYNSGLSTIILCREEQVSLIITYDGEIIR